MTLDRETEVKVLAARRSLLLGALLEEMWDLCLRARQK
jgi:hypothetical protein